MVRKKNQPEYKPRVSSTPNVAEDNGFDFSDFTDSGSISPISFPSLEGFTDLDYSSSVESIPSNYQEHLNCIPKKSFQSLCREIFQDYGNYRIQSGAFDALQVVSEQYLVDLFHYSSLCATHAKRTTLKVKDLKLAVRLLSARDENPEE